MMPTLVSSVLYLMLNAVNGVLHLLGLELEL